MVNNLEIIDVNTWLGAWPFQYVDEETSADLDELLESEGIAHAYVGTPEASFNPDCAEANRRLMERVHGYPRFSPVPTINPAIRGWSELLGRYRDAGVGVIRIMPSFHGYACTGREASALVEAAGEFVLIIQVRMEDERVHNPVCRIAPPPTEDIVELASRYPSVSMIAACAYFHEATEIAATTTNVLFELSHIESMRTITSLTKKVPAERVLFGSHAPYLSVRSATMKLFAQDVPEAVRSAVASGNAGRVFRRNARGRR